jgi:Asp-tRNA(Asn)/Glu-tRNA(Gln) amidotransferase A subunit family amidase
VNPVLLSATEQLRLLRSGAISASELAEAHLAQIERLNPLLQALVDVDPERVRAQARASCAGALAGLPLTVKSSIATAGYRCEIGSTLQRGTVPSADARAVARLRAAGAVLLGTTNCPEFLMAYETANLLHGRTANPWALDRSAGGSSGGESAAIAAGMSAGGLGSDSGGSVRVPAAFTGICALKPTSGRISAEGHLPPCVGPFAKLGAIGPMARTMEDVALLYRAAAEDARRPVNLDEARRVRVGYFEEDGLVPVDPAIRAAVRSAAEALRAAGFTVEPFRPEGLEEARRLWDVFFVQCGAMFYGPTIAGREAELSPVFREFLAIAGTREPLTAERLLFAWAEWDAVCNRILEQMRVYPVLLTPVCAVPAFRHGERAWEIEGRTVTYLDAMRFTQWFNTLGAPAAVVPVASSRDGLPLGVQVAGRPFEDELVLAVAGLLDQEFGYRPPPLALHDGAA